MVSDTKRSSFFLVRLCLTGKTVCDPVMGDLGRIYVAPEIIPLYRNILEIVDVLTPNQFETE